MTIIAIAEKDLAPGFPVQDVAEKLTDVGRGDCPPWCAVHCPGSNGSVLHISEEYASRTTAGGQAEHRLLIVEVEQEQRPDTGLQTATVRLMDTPMTAAEALELAGNLVLAARQAFGMTR